MQLTNSPTFGILGGIISNIGFIFVPATLLHFSIVYARKFKSNKKKMENLHPRSQVDEGPKKYLLLMYLLPFFISLLIVFTSAFFLIEKVVPSDRIVDSDGGGEYCGSFNSILFMDNNCQSTELFGEDSKEDIEKWFFKDINGDMNYSVVKDKPEPIMKCNGSAVLILFDYDNHSNSTGNSTNTVAVNNSMGNVSIGDSSSIGNGSFNCSEVGGSWISFKNAKNKDDLFWLDDEKTMDSLEGVYDDGETVYLDNGNGKWDSPNAIWVEENADNQNFVYVQGPYYPFLILSFFIYLIAALAYLLNHLITAKKKKYKKQIKFLVNGLFGITLYIVVSPFFPSFLPGIIMDSFLTLLLSLFLAIAVLKYKLLDVQLIIKKSLTYSTVVLTIALLFTIVGETVEFVVGNLLPSVSDLYSNIIAALIVSLMFMPIIKATKNLFNRLFPKIARYDKEYVARLTAYEATIEAMWQDEMITDKEEEAIKILRKRLNIHKNEHDDILDRIKTKKTF